MNSYYIHTSNAKFSGNLGGVLSPKKLLHNLSASRFVIIPQRLEDIGMAPALLKISNWNGKKERDSNKTFDSIGTYIRPNKCLCLLGQASLRDKVGIVLWTLIGFLKGTQKLTEGPKGTNGTLCIDLLGPEYIAHKLCPKPLFGYVFRYRNNLWVVYWIFVPNTISPFHPSWGKLFEFHEAQPCWPTKRNIKCKWFAIINLKWLSCL